MGGLLRPRVGSSDLPSVHVGESELGRVARGPARRQRVQRTGHRARDRFDDGVGSIVAGWTPDD